MPDKEVCLAESGPKPLEQAFLVKITDGLRAEYSNTPPNPHV